MFLLIHRSLLTIRSFPDILIHPMNMSFKLALLLAYLLYVRLHLLFLNIQHRILLFEIIHLLLNKQDEMLCFFLNETQSLMLHSFFLHFIQDFFEGLLKATQQDLKRFDFLLQRQKDVCCGTKLKHLILSVLRGVGYPYLLCFLSMKLQ